MKNEKRALFVGQKSFSAPEFYVCHDFRSGTFLENKLSVLLILKMLKSNIFLRLYADELSTNDGKRRRKDPARACQNHKAKNISCKFTSATI